MRTKWFAGAVAVLTLAGLSPLALAAQTARTALPGTVNYVEGQVSIDGNTIGQNEVGTAQVAANQTLTTGTGKAELLLSPGVFLRAGDNTEVRMVSPELVNPTFEVVHGEVMVEVDQKPKDADITVLQNEYTATILKPGLYDFNSDAGRVRVMDGKLKVTEDDQSKEIGKGKELALNGEKLKAVAFNRKDKDNLYRWSNVRSDYLAQANESTAQNIYMGYDPFWGTGWYWNPYFASWSWLPGDGFFYSPFGYPFFSPGYVGYAPYYGGLGYRGGLGVARGIGPRTGVNLAPRFGGRFAGGGFAGRGIGGGFAGRGIGGGGFHGGGFGGGFHGGGGRR